MRYLYSTIALVIVLIACSSNNTPNNLSNSPGFVDQFQVISTADAYGGATPAGASGPYSVITAVVKGKLNPKHPNNAGIVDILNAPVGSDGLVAYSTDVVILRPKSASTARRVMFYDVVNRGNKIGLTRYVGPGAMDTGAAPNAAFPSLLSSGYTVVWSGWQSNVAQTGTSATAGTGLVGTNFPTAINADGSPITGLSREEYIPDYAGGTLNLIPLSYPPASMTDMSQVTFTARQSWLNASGLQEYNVPSVPVTTWSYVTATNGTVSVQFTPPASVPTPNGSNVAPDSGTIYSFVYNAKNPVISGIGFAAVRDLITFLKNSSSDAQGNANPLNDMKGAACADPSSCASNPSTNYDVSIAEGVSQSGRYLRDFLYQGFNDNAAGGKVFDGMLPIIPAGRRTWTNWRFNQAGRWGKMHEDHWMPGDQFPFSYTTITDPVGGTNDGLMKLCLATNTCPKIMQIDGTFEWWGGRASLVVTDGKGKDLALPNNVRYYLIAGTQHGGGAGVTTGVVVQPSAATAATLFTSNLCQFASSPVSMTPVERSLIPAMENWITRNINPPASQYPTVAAGTLVAPSQAAIGFPVLTTASVPNITASTAQSLNANFAGSISQIMVTDYSKAVPSYDLSKQYTVLVPKVDKNGNEISGILMPEMAVPVATYAGWNVRGAFHAMGEGCSSTGSSIQLPLTAAAAQAAGDSRSALSNLYLGRADYINKFSTATDSLVSRGFLTNLDALNVYKLGAQSISPTLIPNP
ncbi:MAG: alpha/beta hydrolase domain-containing protein [Betaproteobacteria bacterium]